MECQGTSKAIIKILSPIPDKLTFGSPPVGAEVFERAPLWQINYSYEFDNGNFYQGYSYYGQAWGEEGEISLRFEQLETGWKIWITGRYLGEDGLLGGIQEAVTEQDLTGNRIIRNFESGNKLEASPRAWKLVISDISGPVVERFYEQEPEWEIICGCKVGDCEIPCSKKPEGFCCLSKSKVEFIRRKLRESKPWYIL